METNILKKVTVGCLYAVLVTPLLVWGIFLFPFISPKTFFFRIAIEFALFFYLLLIIYHPQYRPRFSKLTWIILIYLLIITFASIFGVDAYRSFWGNIERGEGLLTIYHLFIFFVLITSLFKEKKDWLRFFNFSILISLLMSFYALGQKFELNFLLRSSGGGRLTATIGNASFLAAYLLLHIFLCLFLFINKKKRNWRIAYGLIFLFETYILFQTGTRGAILGLVAGFLVLSILSIIFLKNRKIRRNFAVLFLILMVFSTSVWLCRDQAWVAKTSGLNRLASISLIDVTTQSRLLGWQAAWRGWKDKFVLGYGYENYNVAFNKYFPVLIYRDSGSQIWFDRAHNVVFDQAVTGGIFGLLAYFSIFGAVLWILWSQHRSEKDYASRLSLIVLASLLVAYFFQNLFVFDTLGTYIFFYFILGYISYLSIRATAESNKPLIKSGAQANPFWVVMLILILIFSVYTFNLKPARANYLCVKGMIYSYSNAHRDALAEFKKSLDYGTYQKMEIRQNLSQVAINAFKSQQLNEQEIKESFDYTVSELKKNIEMSPLDARQYLFLIKFYNDSISLKLFDSNEIINLGNKALELSPTRPQFYTIMGQTKINLGEYSKGIDYFKKALDLNPKVMESHWSLAVAYIITGHDDLAKEEFATMKEMGFDYYSKDNLKKMVRVYSAINNFQEVISIYNELIKLEPDNSSFYAQLAAVYGKVGQLEKARETVKKAVELDPGLQEEAEAFLKLLQ